MRRQSTRLHCMLEAPLRPHMGCCCCASSIPRYCHAQRLLTLKCADVKYKSRSGLLCSIPADCRIVIAAAAVCDTCAPPFGSSSIFNIDRGPSVVLMMSDTACSMECNVRYQQSMHASPSRFALGACCSCTPLQLRCCPLGPYGPAPVSCLHLALLLEPAWRRSQLGCCLHLNQRLAPWAYRKVLLRLTSTRFRW